MKSVCIVGAGPAGLAAAKVLAPHFKVVIFEQSGRIGGIWDDAVDSFLDRTTPTNLSRHTVSFSDLDWNSVLPQENHAVSLFPKAWQVNRYLQAYAEKLPRDTILLNHKVVKTERVVSQDRTTASWLISVASNDQPWKFDYLVLGTGFFSQPRPLSMAVPANSLHASNIVCMHSSQFRKLADIFPRGQDAAGKTILVIGGGNSSGETAANIAQQLSDSQYSPNSSMRDMFRDCRIVHVSPRPLYALPPFVPSNADYTTFVPLDFKLYDLSRRPPGDIRGNAGRVADAVKNMIHDAMQTTIGGDQSDLGSAALTIPPGEPRSTVSEGFRYSLVVLGFIKTATSHFGAFIGLLGKCSYMTGFIGHKFARQVHLLTLQPRCHRCMSRSVKAMVSLSEVASFLYSLAVS